MDRHNENRDKGSEKEISFRIDGRKFTTTIRSQSAADLLRSAGLDPAQYDLAQIAGGRTERYGDERVINLNNGDKFASIRQTAAVA